MHINAYVGYIYGPIDTKFCIQVCLGGIYVLHAAISFSIFSLILDFEKVAFISVYLNALVGHIYLQIVTKFCTQVCLAGWYFMQ